MNVLRVRTLTVDAHGTVCAQKVVLTFLEETHFSAQRGVILSASDDSTSIRLSHTKRALALKFWGHSSSPGEGGSLSDAPASI